MSFFNNKDAISESGGGGESHNHDNISTLNKIEEIDGELYFNEEPVGEGLTEEDRVKLMEAYEHISKIVDVDEVHGFRVNDNGDLEYLRDSEWTKVSDVDENHTHTINDIENLQDMLNEKSEAGHKHEISDIISLQDKLDSKADSNHTHDMSDIETGNLDASRVSETEERQFISSSDKSALSENSDSLEQHRQRLVELEDGLNSVDMTDEKVKMEESGEEGYLADFIDKTTIINSDGKLVSKKLDGMLATTQEINHLQGVSDNIQKQIDELENIDGGLFSENS